MTKPRDREKEVFWRKHVESCEASSLGIRAYCERSKLNENQFYAWRRELRLRRCEDSSSVRFAAVTVTPGDRPSPTEILIQLPSGVQVRVGAEVSPDRVGDVLARLPC